MAEFNAKTQIKLLSSAQTGALGTSQIQALTTAQLGAFAKNQVTGLSTTQIAAFTTGQIGGLAAAAIKAFSSTQIGALETEDLQQLTAAQFKGFAKLQVDGLTTAQIVALETSQIAGITPLIKFLSTAQVAALETQDLAEFNAKTQIKLLSSAQTGALGTSQIQALTTAQIGAFAKNQVAGLTTAQIAAFTTGQIGGLTAATIKAFSEAQIQALETEDLAQLTAAQFKDLPVDKLTIAQIPGLGANQIEALTNTQVGKLSTAQILALTSTQIGSLSAVAVQALSNAQIQALDDDIVGLTKIGSLKNTQIVALTTAQAALLTNTQMGALTAAQIGAMETSDLAVLSSTQLNVWSGTQIMGLSVDQLSALNVTSTDVTWLTTTTAQISPLVLDLNGDDIKTLSLAQGTQFALDPDVPTLRNGWVDANDGLLVRDLNANGKIDDGTELFGTATRLANGEKATDGYAALSELDSNGDGAITAADAVWSELKVWQDSNSDGVSQAGELKSLAELGIKQMDLNAQATSVMNNGNWVGLVSSFETVDGETHEMADVWFTVEKAGVQAAGDVLRTQVGGMVQAMAEFASGAGTPTGTTGSLTDAPDPTRFAASVASMATTLTSFMQGNPDFGAHSGTALASVLKPQEPGKPQTDLLTVSPMLTSSS